MTEETGSNGAQPPETADEERLSLTEAQALELVCDASKPLDVRFEIAAAVLVNLIPIRNETLARVASSEAMNFVLMRHILSPIEDVEERIRQLHTLREEVRAFIEATNSQAVDIWEYVGGATLQEVLVSSQETIAALEKKMKDDVDAQLKAAAQQGDLEKGTCSIEECLSPYECTKAQTCLGTLATAPPS